MKRSADQVESASPSPFWRSGLGVVLRRALLALAWLAIWGALLMACAEVAFAWYITPSTSEGFTALLGMFGVLVLGPVGFLLSCLFARPGRAWPFLAGAVLTGIGTVPVLLLQDRFPGLVWLGAVALVLVAGWAWLRGRSPRTR